MSFPTEMLLQIAAAPRNRPFAYKHPISSYDHNLPPALFRGREIACSRTRRIRSCRAGQIYCQMEDDLAPSLKQPYTLTAL
jgi:hypothetical protein